MTLKTLIDKKEIGGFPVLHMSEIDKALETNCHIIINHKDNVIYTQIQDGPIKESGVNGCQVDTLIHMAKHMYEGFQSMGTPSSYTAKMIGHCQAILDLTEARTKDREKRGVEGTSKA